MRRGSGVPDPLPLVVRPVPGENVVGLLSRLADAMCASFSSVLSLLGIRADFMLTDEAWSTLAAMLGLQEEAFAGMRRSRVRIGRASTGIRLLGNLFRHHLIVRDVLRVCPSCIREGGIIAERWDIAHAPVCLRHGLLLVDACECGRPLSRRYRGMQSAFSCVCGTPFANLETREASPTLMMLGGIVEAATAGIPCAAPLEPELAGLPISDLLCVAHSVGLAITTPEQEDEAAEPRGAVYNSVRLDELRDVASMLPIIEAATPVLLDWSAAYPAVLERIAGRNREAGSASADALFATRIGRLLRRPCRGVDNIPIACMTTAIERFCEDRHGIRPRRGSVRRDSPVARRIEGLTSRRRIAARLGVAAQAPMLRRIYEEVVRSFDEERLAASRKPKALALDVETEVLRRWANTTATMSTDEAARHLGHKRSSHSPGNWIHPDLLVPIDPAGHGVDGLLSHRRGGVSFLASDVEALRDRMASRVQTVADAGAMDGYEPLGQCRRFHGGGWPRTDFVLAFLAGRIPARSLVARPRLSDIWFHVDTVHALSLEHRVGAVVDKDSFAIAHRCRALVTELWGGCSEDMTDFHLRHLRRTRAIRFTDVRNTTGGRDRPLYHYSMVDLLERARLIRGASLTPLVDKLIDAHREARDPATRVAVDGDQTYANAYIAGVARHVRRSLNGAPGDAPAAKPNPGLAPPSGWRRTGD